MAEIHPFRALHYNPLRIQELWRVVTQPYDKISPEMQSRYYRCSPFNLVRVIRGQHHADDNSQDNVYLRAARHYRQWIEDRILVSQAEPAIYPYDQEYEVPGWPGSKKVRRGFIALCQLEDYSQRIVHPHEETLSAPKTDRLELLKATRAHFGQIFVLYSDPTGLVESLLAEEAQQKPWEQVSDEHNTLHSVWRITEPRAIEPVVAAMAAKKLVIADGHHRYETALAYRDYCRIQGISDNRADYVMMTFIRMEADGLTILPTHRLVHSLPAFNWAGFLSQARSIFDAEEFADQSDIHDWAKRFLETLARAGREGPAFGAYAGPGKLALLRLRSDFNLDGALNDLPPTLRRLERHTAAPPDSPADPRHRPSGCARGKEPDLLSGISCCGCGSCRWRSATLPSAEPHSGGGGARQCPGRTGASAEVHRLLPQATLGTRHLLAG